MTLLGCFAIPFDGFYKVQLCTFTFFQGRAGTVLIFLIATARVAQACLELLRPTHLFEDRVALVLRFLLSLRECSAEPEVRFGQINSHAAATGQSASQTQLRVGITLFSSRTK